MIKWPRFWMVVCAWLFVGLVFVPAFGVALRILNMWLDWAYSWGWAGLFDDLIKDWKEST